MENRYRFVRLDVQPALPPLQVRVLARTGGVNHQVIRELRDLIGLAETDRRTV